MNKERILSEEIKNIQENKTEIIALKDAIIALKNSIELFNRKLDQVEERIRETEDKAVGIIQSERKKTKNEK